MIRRFEIAQALLIAAAAWFLPLSAAAQLQPSPPVQTIAVRPSLLRDVGLDQRLGEQIPLDLVFRDDRGRTIELSEYFGSKPVVLNLVYYDCPMLCTQVLSGLITSMKQMPL